MKKRTIWGIIGAIIWEAIWIIELAVELYRGEITYTDIISTAVFCLLFAALFISILLAIRRRRQKGRENNSIRDHSVC